MALTATANKKVQLDIMAVLKMENCAKFEQSFNRPNLSYQVRQKDKGTDEDIVKFINEKYRNSCGILYCVSKKDCEETCGRLTKAGLKCAFYHAGLDQEDRKRIQEDWKTDVVKIIIATVISCEFPKVV